LEEKIYSKRDNAASSEKSQKNAEKNNKKKSSGKGKSDDYLGAKK